MELQNFQLVGPQPVKKNEFIKVANKFYKVLTITPLIYQARNIQNNVEIGYNNDEIYYVDKLNPPTNFIYFIFGIGILGEMKFKLDFPPGNPQFSIARVSKEFIEEFMSPVDRPLPINLPLTQNDKISIEVKVPFDGYKGAFIFYGWKIEVELTQKAIDYKDLDQYRRG